MTDAIIDVDELEKTLILFDEMGRHGIWVEVNLVTGCHAVEGVPFTDLDELAEHCREILAMLSRCGTNDAK